MLIAKKYRVYAVYVLGLLVAISSLCCGKPDQGRDGGTATEASGKPQGGMAPTASDEGRMCRLGVAAIGGGSVDVTPPAGAKPGLAVTGAQWFEYETGGAVTSVMLTAVPKQGRVLKEWIIRDEQGKVRFESGLSATIELAERATAAAIFGPKGGAADDATDFVGLVWGPGEISLLVLNVPTGTTHSSITGSIAAGATIDMSIEPAVPGKAVFSHWELCSDGATEYVTEDKITISKDTVATAFFYGFVPQSFDSSSLSTRVLGKGSISIGEGRFQFDKNTNVTVVATPAEGWAFKTWRGDGPLDSSAQATVDMMHNTHVIAEFVRRDGKDELNLVRDLARFLVDVGQAKTEVDVDSLLFDLGDASFHERDAENGKGILTKNERGVQALLPNRIPDAVELRLLQHVLENTNMEDADVGGVSNEIVWGAYRGNLNQANSELADLPDYVRSVVAAYMTLGTDGHAHAMKYFLRERFGVDFEPAGYNRGSQSHFGEQGDVDNDGKWNYEEWEMLVENNPDTRPIDLVDRYVETATDRKLEGGVPVTY